MASFAKIQGIILKNTIGLSLLAIWLVAFASNNPTQVAKPVDDSSEDGKVCTYETGGRIGSKMRRVCRTVEASQSPIRIKPAAFRGKDKFQR